MKNQWKGLITALFCLLLAAALSTCSFAEDAASSAVSCETVQETGPSGSYVRYPVLHAFSGVSSDGMEKINQAIQEKAHIASYLQLLSTVSEGSAGLQVDYEITLPAEWTDGEDHASQFCSILFSAQGKMLSGRPSQVYYPMNFDLQTGEEVTFDQLFTDPDGAKAFMEAYVQEEVAPTLSTYLENSGVLPVPFDRFFLDGMGNLCIVYENGQLSFLSGFSGMIAFRYSELWSYLDTAENGIPMRMLRHPGQYDAAAFPEAMRDGFYTRCLPGLSKAPCLASVLDETLEALRPAADSSSYPGGSCYEVEEASLRGTLILTGEDETTVNGLLASRIDCFGIETGKTTLEQAMQIIPDTPAVQLALSDSAAELYRVCPGAMVLYQGTDAAGNPLSLTLYADDGGIVQYIRLAVEAQ